MATDKEVPEPRQDPHWKDPVFRAALWVGGALVIIGLGCFSALPVVQTVSALILCSGHGIFFGAFGSTAVVTYQKGVVVAGVAAIAMLLVYLFNYLTRDNIVRLRITGDVKGSALDLYGDEAYPGADHSQFYEFVVIGRELKISHLSLMVTVPASPERPNERREVLFECIPGQAIGPFLGSGKTPAMAIRCQARAAHRSQWKECAEWAVRGRDADDEVRGTRICARVVLPHFIRVRSNNRSDNEEHGSVYQGSVLGLGDGASGCTPDVGKVRRECDSSAHGRMGTESHELSHPPQVPRSPSLENL